MPLLYTTLFPAILFSFYCLVSSPRGLGVPNLMLKRPAHSTSYKTYKADMWSSLLQKHMDMEVYFKDPAFLSGSGEHTEFQI